LPNPKGLPSSLVQLRTAVWTGDARVTRPAADFAEQGSDEAVPRWAWDANTICQGWILEHDGARWARARDSSTNARGTDSGKKHPRRMTLSDRFIKD